MQYAILHQVGSRLLTSSTIGKTKIVHNGKYLVVRITLCVYVSYRRQAMYVLTYIIRYRMYRIISMISTWRGLMHTRPAHRASASRVRYNRKTDSYCDDSDDEFLFFCQVTVSPMSSRYDTSDLSSF